MDGGGKVKRTATRSDLGIHPPEFRRLTLKVEVFSEYPATWLAGPSDFVLTPKAQVEYQEAHHVMHMYFCIDNRRDVIWKLIVTGGIFNSTALRADLVPPSIFSSAFELWERKTAQMQAIDLLRQSSSSSSLTVLVVAAGSCAFVLSSLLSFVVLAALVAASFLVVLVWASTELRLNEPLDLLLSPSFLLQPHSLYTYFVLGFARAQTDGRPITN
ncbi:hypothetical protein C8J57DRAFT_1529600 [Mycena rebaudengoi]|nr:hypothetical protein C8J57DRAFT_1529600 [Mycena rebaudengoi]